MTESDLQGVVTAFGATWSAKDAAGAVALWDFTDPQATYLAAGTPQPMIGEAAIRGYIESACGAFARIAMRPGAATARALGGDLGLATFALEWALQAKPTAKPFGGTVRATLLLRRVGGAWRIFHYVESPLDLSAVAKQISERAGADIFAQA